jgi:hypothetical protein
MPDPPALPLRQSSRCHLERWMQRLGSAPSLALSSLSSLIRFQNRQSRPVPAVRVEGRDGLRKDLLLRDGIEQRHARTEFHVIRRTEDIGYGLFVCRQNKPRAFEQARSEQIISKYAMASAREPIAKRCAIGLKPRPAICGKMNHIQCDCFRPCDSSATTCG